MPHITPPDTPRFSVGIALDGAGAHPAAWREPDADAGSLFAPEHWQTLIDALDEAGADYVAVEDSLAPQRAVWGDTAETAAPHPLVDSVTGRLDALLLLSWVAPRTRRIGLIPTVTTTHTEPFHVATALQTLDHISGGRAGWQLRISPSAAEAEAFGRRDAPAIDFDAVLAGRADAALDELFDEAADVAEVASRLWDSWEDGAIIRETETGRFLDRDRLHHVRFEGARFSVAGPSIVPRSPQGRPPITLLAHSEPVYRLAAQAADVVFVTPEPHSAAGGGSVGRSASEIVAAVRRAEAEAGRGTSGAVSAPPGSLGSPDVRGDRAPLRIVADLVVALDGAAETGAERLARLDAIGPRLASDARVATGAAEQIADLIADWQAAGIEGVRLRPLAQPSDVRAIAEDLLPELRRRGLAAPVVTPDVHDSQPSLRERFGLGEAVNRYAAVAASHSEEVAA